ncbi:glycoside hydrolase family 27 protein [Kutzneria sp. CA-103260]|uniref:glycoside hydrolase family 27 protein n=1 Tax=Kutzneria sp. CA-103260 TaxID=2802641 RepID=UPI001BA77C98|nr:glycoside hydrolase family 27 protein [Kutzneria sp. CA-103260]QUQ71935.1 carbohydrate-binding protein [Kutzneria sp. CA-103260]
MTRWRIGAALLTAAAALLATGSQAIADVDTHGAAWPHPVTIAKTPPMGWSSWSSLHGNISESIIEAQAKVLHDQLKDHGYQYVNIDAGWTAGVDQYGRSTWDTTKFPNGIAAVAKYVHGLGLKFGIYMVPGIPKAAVDANSPIKGTPYHVKDVIDPTQPGNTAADSSGKLDFTKPGAAAYVQSQADLLASWGVDYIKMDFVGPGGGRVATDNRTDMQVWRKSLDNTRRPIHLELSNSLSFDNAAVWQKYSNGWRIEGDIECYSHCVGLTNWAVRASLRWDDAPKWVPFAGPGHWNDLDSLEIGNGATDGLSADEKQSVMTLWAIESSPLLLGTDLTKLVPEDVKMITNDEVIAVDQAGHPAHPVSQASKQQVWVSDNHNGSYTVALFNLGDAPATVTANWTDLAPHRSIGFIRDLWAHKNLGLARDHLSATLAPHASRLLTVWL